MSENTEKYRIFSEEFFFQKNVLFYTQKCSCDNPGETFLSPGQKFIRLRSENDVYFPRNLYYLKMFQRIVECSFDNPVEKFLTKGQKFSLNVQKWFYWKFQFAVNYKWKISLIRTQLKLSLKNSFGGKLAVNIFLKILECPFSNYSKILRKDRKISNFEESKSWWCFFSKSYASMFLKGSFNKVGGRKISRWYPGVLFYLARLRSFSIQKWRMFSSLILFRIIFFPNFMLFRPTKTEVMTGRT